MKAFIVFSGLLVLCVSCMVYQADAMWYVHDQRHLKAAAEEAACQAVLCLDEEAYGEGMYKFDYENAEEYARRYLASAQGGLKARIAGEPEYRISFEDDVCGYSLANAEKNPSVVVEAALETEDMFRLPALTKRGISAEARYEIKRQ